MANPGWSQQPPSNHIGRGHSTPFRNGLLAGVGAYQLESDYFAVYGAASNILHADSSAVLEHIGIYRTPDVKLTHSGLLEWLPLSLLMNSQEAEQAMPLEQFIDETISVLRTDADEILVEAAKPLRANAGPHEHGLVNGFNAQMMATFARG
jgi:uncharacterized oxidoreductase